MQISGLAMCSWSQHLMFRAVTCSVSTNMKDVCSERLDWFCFQVINELPAVFLSSQEWSCWPSEYGGRWVWRPIYPWHLTRAPMPRMCSSGPEPPSLSSGCSAALPHAAAAHGCSNWSVKGLQALFNIPCRCGSRCVIVSFACFLQYAMFLTLVFLAELVAGVSGFIFRHEVSQTSKASSWFENGGEIVLIFGFKSPRSKTS